MDKKFEHLSEQIFNRLSQLIKEEEALESLYRKFQINDSFRYKVVGTLMEHGYLFHGTTESFESFDPSYIKGGSRGNYGYGFYFTNAAYKCSEYGNEFKFVDGSKFNFLELEDNASENERINGILSRIEDLNQRIFQYKEALYNVRTNREYNYYESELKKCKDELDKLFGNEQEKDFFEQYEHILRKNPDIYFHNLTKKLYQIFARSYGIGFVSQMFLKKFGYDGFHIGAEFVIFNFEKLNQYLISDNEELLRRFASLF